MAQPDTKNIQVAIVGGGVCGLACAVALQNAGVHAEVFEAAVRFATDAIIFRVFLKTGF